MKETSSPSSPLVTPETPRAGGAAAAAAVGTPAEKQTPAASRVKSFCCSASLSFSPSSNSSSSSFSSQLGSPMTPPSPFYSSSAVPFSWERQPGVPKLSQHPKEHRQCPDPTLPPPPPLRSNSDPLLSVAGKKRPELSFAADPFAVALIECSKEDRRHPAEEDEDSPGLQWKGAAGGRRRMIADLFGFVDLYTSCKTTCSVADSTVYIPRSGRGMAGYGLVSRRAE